MRKVTKFFQYFQKFFKISQFSSKQPLNPIKFQKFPAFQIFKKTNENFRKNYGKLADKFHPSQKQSHSLKNPQIKMLKCEIQEIQSKN